MTPIELRKLQEAVANLSLVKDELAKGMFELYASFKKAGFSQLEALELTKSYFKGD